VSSNRARPVTRTWPEIRGAPGSGTTVPIELDDPRHSADFVRLNELWISEHFALEQADRALAADPMKIVRDGGHILARVEDGRVVGVCALFKESEDRYQLARMAVEPAERGKGYGDELVAAALAKAKQKGARSIYLLSNTVLTPALALYRKYGFRTVSQGRHPVYARCDVVMERSLD
jgi:putative acetyltransferase